LSRSRIQSTEVTPMALPRLPLGSRLPINLRQFLANQLGSAASVEEDSIVSLTPRTREALMRGRARAIRRLSAERAREAWTECALSFNRLEHEFFGPNADGRSPVVLCLRCIAFGTGALDQHCGKGCVPVNLSTGVRMERIERGPDASLADAMHRAVQNFRNARSASHRPHHDLDCYMAAGQVVFTWRPLEPLTAKQ